MDIENKHNNEAPFKKCYKTDINKFYKGDRQTDKQFEMLKRHQEIYPRM